MVHRLEEPALPGVLRGKYVFQTVHELPDAVASQRVIHGRSLLAVLEDAGAFQQRKVARDRRGIRTDSRREILHAMRSVSMDEVHHVDPCGMSECFQDACSRFRAKSVIRIHNCFVK